MIIRALLYLLVGYLIYKLIQLVVIATRLAKQGSMHMNPENGNSGFKKEKDISRVARILDEKRPDKTAKKSK